MRDFRDAKSMAHDLREALSAKYLKITNSESLEIIARLFGVSDWNTLSALIKQPSQQGPTEEPTRRQNPYFSEGTETALQGALRLAYEGLHAESTVEHLLLALTEAPEVAALMSQRAIEPNKFRESLTSSFEIAAPGDQAPRDPVPSPAFQRVVQRAILNAQSSRNWKITPADLLVAILTEQEGTGVRLLREHGLDRGTG
jgi:hypothetical protein